MAELEEDEVRYTMILTDNGMIVRAYPFKSRTMALRMARLEAINPHRIADAQHVVLWDMDTQKELFSTHK